MFLSDIPIIQCMNARQGTNFNLNHVDAWLLTIVGHFLVPIFTALTAVMFTAHTGVARKTIRVIDNPAFFQLLCDCLIWEHTWAELFCIELRLAISEDLFRT